MRYRGSDGWVDELVDYVPEVDAVDDRGDVEPAILIDRVSGGVQLEGRAVELVPAQLDLVGQCGVDGGTVGGNSAVSPTSTTMFDRTQNGRG